MKSYDELPYRACVGITLINAQGHVFIGRRIAGPEHTDDEHVWQMPQGGIDEGESPWQAAQRELFEETNVRSIERLGEAPGWLTYDIPRTVGGRAWKGRYRGQKQKWFALRFTGKDSEIDVRHPGGGKHRAEFVDWRWEKLENIPGLIIPFKRPVYDEVAAAFAALAVPA